MRTGVLIYGAINPKIFRSVLFVKNQSYPKIKMPLTCVGDLLTINFDKTITKNLQLQKFVVPLHCQPKRMARCQGDTDKLTAL